MKNKVYYGVSQVYYGKSCTLCGPIRLLDLNQLCSNYTLPPKENSHTQVPRVVA